MRAQSCLGAALVEPFWIFHQVKPVIAVLGAIQLRLALAHPDPVDQVRQVSGARLCAPDRLSQQRKGRFLQVQWPVLDQQPCRVRALFPGDRVSRPPVHRQDLSLRAVLALSSACTTAQSARDGGSGSASLARWSASARASSSARSAAAAGVKLTKPVISRPRPRAYRFRRGDPTLELETRSSPGRDAMIAR